MNTIYLHGSLEAFGGPYRMEVESAREAFTALCSQLEGFEQVVREGAFRIVRRKKNDETEIDESLLNLGCEECRIDIYPAMVGAGGKGIGKVVLGIAIVGAAILTAGAAAAPGAALFTGSGAAMAAGVGFMGITYGGIAAFGAMLAFGGLAMMLAPSPAAQDASAAKEDGSYILSGPVNTQQQGGPVPLVYGRFLTGSVTISSSITIDQLLSSGQTYDADKSWDDQGFPNYPGQNAVPQSDGTTRPNTVEDITTRTREAIP